MLRRTFSIPDINVRKFSSCEETGQRKQTTLPVADEHNFSFCHRGGIEARSAQSRDSLLERDWCLANVSFLSVEVMPVQGIALLVTKIIVCL